MMYEEDKREGNGEGGNRVSRHPPPPFFGHIQQYLSETSTICGPCSASRFDKDPVKLEATAKHFVR